MAIPAAADHSRPHASARRRGLETAKTYPILFYGSLLGLHVNLGLPVFEGTVPNIISAPFALALVILHWRRLPSGAVPWLAAMVGLFVLSAVYALAFQRATQQSVLPIGLLGYTLLLGLGIFLEITAMSKERLNRLAIVLATGMVVLAILEVYTPVQQIAIWFEQFYFGRNSNMLRDVALFGGYRPSLFASEPSRAAIGLSVVISIWVFTTGKWSKLRLLIFALLLMAALFVIRSPFTIMPALLFGARLVLWPERSAAARREGIAVQSGRLAVVVVGGLVAATLLASALGATFGTRISQFDTRTDWSVTVRTYGALLAGWNAAAARPLFGAGINNFPAAPEVSATFRALGVPAYVTETDALEASVGNALAVSMIYFGFGGLVLFLWIWEGFTRTLCPRVPWNMRWAVLICVAAAYNEIYNPAFIWTVLVLLGGLVVSTKTHQAGTPAATRRKDLTRGFPPRSALGVGRW